MVQMMKSSGPQRRKGIDCFLTQYSSKSGNIPHSTLVELIKPVIMEKKFE